MFKRVISFGDSFVYGSELSDCIDIDKRGKTLRSFRDEPEKYKKELKLLQERKSGPFSEAALDGSVRGYRAFSYKTWPGLIARHYNAEYYSRSFAGGSNQSIIRKLTKHLIEFNESDLVIIDWTFIDRWDYFDIAEILVDYQWKTLTPMSANDSHISEFYYKYVQSELWNKWESLRAMMLAKYMLESHNITYFMTCQDELVVETTYHNPSYIVNAQNVIKENIFWFENKGFYHWATEKGFPVGEKNGHPLEDAHEEAFNYILSNYEFT